MTVETQPPVQNDSHWDVFADLNLDSTPRTDLEPPSNSLDSSGDTDSPPPRYPTRVRNAPDRYGQLESPIGALCLSCLFIILLGRNVVYCICLLPTIYHYVISVVLMNPISGHCLVTIVFVHCST